MKIEPAAGETGLLRSATMQNALSVLVARRRAEEEIFEAKEALEVKTRELEHSLAVLRESEERFAQVFRSNLMAIGIAEKGGRLVDVNARFAEFFGYGREDMVGRTVFELGLWADLADRARLIAGLAASPISTVEADFRRKSGELRHAQVSMEAMTLAGVAEPLHMVVLLDMTGSHELEAQLRQAQKMEAVGRLAGGIAHDFNNSLGVILGYAELLLRDASAAQAGKLEQILKATQHASSLTRQLLAFSRKQVVDPKVLDLNALLVDLESMLGRLIGEDIDLAIVPGGELGQVRADPGQLQQVAMNLAVNARDAMPHGGLLRIETGNVEVGPGHAVRHEPMAAGRYVILSVSDTGCGMDEDTLSRIFDPFFTTKEEGIGTGLGLGMVYGIVKQAGGHIWVDSERGRGTTFKVYLPRIDEAVAPLPAPEADVPARGWETILLVEDESALREITREVLEEHGYRVVAAVSASDAIALARFEGAPLHLLLTDVVMPGMNGRALTDTLLLTRPTLKILYMSGYTDDVIAHHGVLEPGTLLLEKPFTARALLGRVRSALDSPGAGVAA